MDERIANRKTENQPADYLWDGSGHTAYCFIILYLFAVRLVYSYEKRQIKALMKEMADELRYEKISMRTALIHYGINACIVTIAAVFLPKIGEGISATTGLLLYSLR